MPTDGPQLRQELLRRARELRARLQAIAAELEDDQPLGKAGWAPPVQSLTQPVEAQPDFRLADFPEAVRKCKQIIMLLRKHKDAGAFNQPVDPLALQIPDYHNIVKNPMDLGTVAKRLDNYHQHYVMAQDLAEDVRLIWNNCKLYNGQQHGLSLIASELERLFESKFKQVLDRYSVLEPGAGTPAKKPRLSGVFEKSHSLTEEVPMSYDEKQQLGVLIGSLDSMYSTQVFELIQNSCPQALDDTSDEVELDIEKLDAHTARELERFVKSVANRPKGRVA